MRMNEARRQIAAYGRRMSADRLSTGTSGNLSIYDPAEGLMAISPSGMAYDAIAPEDVVVMDLEARVVEGERKPSSEWALHTAFYKAKPRARAVVHAHSMYCTTFAILGRPLRAVHYMIGSAGTDVIPCAPYRTFGTPELAEAAVEELEAGKGADGGACAGERLLCDFARRHTRWFADAARLMAATDDDLYARVAALAAETADMVAGRAGE